MGLVRALNPMPAALVSNPVHRHTLIAGASTLAVAALVFVACGGGSSGSGTTTSTPEPEDLRMTAAGFPNVHALTRVGNHFVGNFAGHLDEALAVARAGEGRYPVGTIIQLVPQEAMVKRRAGFSPSTNDWEFFSLDVSADGTEILARGGAQVLNRFGDSCASCHSAAAARFDFLCGGDHGCEPLPIGDDVFEALQEADPRPLAGY